MKSEITYVMTISSDFYFKQNEKFPQKSAFNWIYFTF